jgi:hypothetical protein
MDRPTETIRELSSLLAEIDQFRFEPGFSDHELDDLHDQLDSYPRKEVFAELLSWIDTLEQLCKSNSSLN